MKCLYYMFFLFIVGVILVYGFLRVIFVFYNIFDFECEKFDCIFFIIYVVYVNSKNNLC